MLHGVGISTKKEVYYDMDLDWSINSLNKSRVLVREMREW